MKHLKSFKLFLEVRKISAEEAAEIIAHSKVTINPESGLTYAQESDIENFLLEEWHIYEKTKEELEELFEPGSQSFADLLSDLDSNFDWFDYRLAPKIIKLLQKLTQEHVPGLDDDEDEDDLGDVDNWWEE